MADEIGRSARIAKRVVDAAKPQAERYTVWDSDLKGFGLRVSPQGTKTYMVRYRAGGGRTGTLRQLVIGRHGVITAEEARDEARKVLASATKGADPQADRAKVRADITVSELCDLYLEQGVAMKKASTLTTDKSRIERHIKPILGSKRVNAVTLPDIERWMQDVATGRTASKIKPSRAQVKAGQAPKDAELRRLKDPVARGGKGTATRTAGLLGGIFEFAVKRKIRSDNPVRGLQRYRDRKMERFLSPAELTALGEAMAASDAAGGNLSATRILRLLALTGARRGEIEQLKWSEVDPDFGCLRLEDSKTGQKIVPIGRVALEVIEAAPKVKGSPFVFPSTTDPLKPFGQLQKTWLVVRKAAGLDDVRIHDLRHSFASSGVASGQGLVVLGKLLGHADVKTTSRYAHLADDPVRAAADSISAHIAKALQQ